MAQLFRENLRRQELLLGTLVTLPCASIAEILSDSGFDWLFFDMEHAPFGLSDVQSMLQATSTEVAGLVRVPANDEVWVKRVLDLGADGIIVPQVMTRADAQRAVLAARYPPQGRRGVGVARAQRYGARLADYLATANDQIATVIQIEHIDAVRAVDDIVTVDGVDAVLIGPFDLSGSLGKLGRIHDDDVREAIATVHAACQRHGITSGIFVPTAAEAVPYIEQGFRLVTVGVDTILLGQAARGIVGTLREQ